MLLPSRARCVFEEASLRTSSALHAHRSPILQCLLQPRPAGSFALLSLPHLSATLSPSASTESQSRQRRAQSRVMQVRLLKHPSLKKKPLITVYSAGARSNRFVVPYALAPTGSRRFADPVARPSFSLYVDLCWEGFQNVNQFVLAWTSAQVRRLWTPSRMSSTRRPQDVRGLSLPHVC